MTQGPDKVPAETSGESTQTPLHPSEEYPGPRRASTGETTQPDPTQLPNPTGARAREGQPSPSRHTTGWSDQSEVPDPGIPTSVRQPREAGAVPPSHASDDHGEGR
jgi:hypothetical protein